ncbi:MAG: O-antigen ligase family protein [Candidatus Magasanikbacteria bacterium]
MPTLSIQKTALKFIALMCALAFLGVWVYFKGQAILVFAGVAVGLWILSYYLEWGWYVLVALSPFINWEIYLGGYRKLFENYPLIARMHAPAVEFWAVLLLIAFGLNLVRRILLGQGFSLKFPLWKYFALFVLSAFVSIINLAPWDKSGGVKYILHFILLFYFGYLMLGANIISSKKIWESSLKILVGAGLLSAVMGLASLIMGMWQYGGFRRAVPFALGSWMPLGDQHIFLAEVLTVAFPIAVYFWYKNRLSKFWFVSALFILIIGLLTLSRAGWITFLVEAIVLWFIFRSRINWSEAAEKWWWLLVIFVPIVAYLGYFLLTSSTVSSSNSARMEITRIAWYYSLRHPLIGNGVGGFVNIVGENRAFILDFGDPTDALGIVQKLSAEMGLLGIITFGLFIGMILKRVSGGMSSIVILSGSEESLKQSRRDPSASPQDDRLFTPEKLLCLFLVLSPLIFQLFNTQFYSSKMWVPIALAVAYQGIKNKE